MLKVRGKYLEPTAPAKQDNAELLVRIADLEKKLAAMIAQNTKLLGELSQEQKDEPEKSCRWEFDVKRNRDGSISKIVAVACDGEVAAAPDAAQLLYGRDS